MLKQKIMKIKLNDNFNIVDKTTTRILIFFICIFTIFNIFNFMTKDNHFKDSIFESYIYEIKDSIKPSILNSENIKLYLYEEKPNLEDEDVYNEVIYFTRKRDIGILIDKAKDLINNSSINVSNKYIQVKIKEYDKEKEIATVIWNRDNKNEYLVYTK